MMILRREYSSDLRHEVSRPHAPRNLVYNRETLMLSWTPPRNGPRFTHFNVYLDNDTAADASYQLPAGTTALYMPTPARVTVTCWNETVATESDGARINVGESSSWTGAASSLFGLLLAHTVIYVLTADITIVSPVLSAPNQRLLIYIYQDAVDLWIPSFDPANFVDSPNWNVDLSMAAVREFAGASDGKWYPVTFVQQFDPAA